jgi:hypothetical protein
MQRRRITLADVDAVTDLAIEAIALAGDVPLHLCRRKIRQMVSNFAQVPGHFQFAAFDGAVPVAAVAMCVAEIPFFERCEGHVMLCYSRWPGAGVPLIRALMEYVAGDIRIRRVQWCMNEHPDPRFARMLERRFGFTHRLDNLVHYKGG